MVSDDHKAELENEWRRLLQSIVCVQGLDDFDEGCRFVLLHALVLYGQLVSGEPSLKFGPECRAQTPVERAFIAERVEAVTKTLSKIVDLDTFLMINRHA